MGKERLDVVHLYVSLVNVLFLMVLVDVTLHVLTLDYYYHYDYSRTPKTTTQPMLMMMHVETEPTKPTNQLKPLKRWPFPLYLSSNFVVCDLG